MNKKNKKILPRRYIFCILLLISTNIFITIGVLSFFEYRYYKHPVIGLEASVVGLFLCTIVTYWLFTKISSIYEESVEEQKMRKGGGENEIYSFVRFTYWETCQ